MMGMGTLPGVEIAKIDIRKLREYVLNPNHPDGRHKARVFAASLGIGPDESDWLASAILGGIAGAEAIFSASNPWGDLYRVDLKIRRADRCALVRTGWLCSGSETKMTTCYVVGGCDEAV